jgi:hypothetical protein
MTSFRQIEPNRRNALKSTGPTTLNGNRQSRRNALRHGLTAETVIEGLEDTEDYRAFEAAISRGRIGASSQLSSRKQPQGMTMAAIERDSVQSGSFHDFKWHRQHRCRRSGQLVDVVILLGWAALVGP